MLDAQFNFNQFFVARRIFSEKENNYSDLAGEMEKAQKIYGYNHLMGNIMDSHDQPRMMALMDGDLTLSDDATKRAWENPPVKVDDPITYLKERIFLTYLISAPGVPIIYYGNEFGMTGAGDPDNRRIMQFNAGLSLEEKLQLQSVRRLINLRKQYSALRRGDFLMLYTSPDVLVYSRGSMDERIIIALNKSQDPEKIILNLPDWMQISGMRSLITGEDIMVINKSLEMTISPVSGDLWLAE
jgi:glycosidase